MRFSEHELTVGISGAAKQVFGAGNKDVRKGRADLDQQWEALTQFQRYQLLDGVGGQILPVLVALPDIEVAAGEKITFTDAQVTEAVETHLDSDLGKIKRKATLLARVALVHAALDAIPPRQDPDGLIVPDHL